MVLIIDLKVDSALFSGDLLLTVKLCVATLLPVYSDKLTVFVASALENTRHVEFYLEWLQSLVTRNGSQPTPTLLLIHKNLSAKYQQLAKM